MSLQAVQIQKLQLAGSGCTSTATSIILQSLALVDGTLVTMTDFGAKGFATLEPGTSKEESISFTGVTQNADGTATLTGVTRGLRFVSPYDSVTANKQAHAGGAVVVVSNTSAFYGNIKDYADGLVTSGAANADLTTKGIVELATAGEIDAGTAAGGTGAALVLTPDAVASSIYASRLPTADEKAALAGLGTPSSSNKFITANALTGMISPYVGRTAPTGYLICDGSAVSRATYANLKAVLAPSMTFTVTQASPAVFTATGHGLVEGDKISLTTTGGFLTGLAANTDYFVIAAGLTSDAFQVSTSRGGAAVNTTGSQSGVHTLHITNFGKGDGSTTFNLPDLRGKTVYGYQSSDDNFDALNVPNTYVGEKTHQLTVQELAAHTHKWGDSNDVPRGATADNLAGAGDTINDTGSTGGDTAHNNMPPYAVLNYIIKT